MNILAFDNFLQSFMKIFDLLYKFLFLIKFAVTTVSRKKCLKQSQNILQLTNNMYQQIQELYQNCKLL